MYVKPETNHVYLHLIGFAIFVNMKSDIPWPAFLANALKYKRQGHIFGKPNDRQSLPKHICKVASSLETVSGGNEAYACLFCTIVEHNLLGRVISYEKILQPLLHENVHTSY